MERRYISQKELDIMLEANDKYLSSLGECGKSANLSFYDLKGLKFCGHNLQFVGFYESDLRGADFRNCNIREINLNFAKTDGLIMPDVPMQCPESGEFVAYKKVLGGNIGGNKWYIARLLIPSDAKRTSGLTKTCRSDKAIVMCIEDMDGNIVSRNTAYSWYDPAFVYMVGHEAIADDFDSNRWSDYTHGIHFYTNRKDVINFG